MVVPCVEQGVRIHQTEYGAHGFTDCAPLRTQVVFDAASHPHTGRLLIQDNR